MSRYDAAIGGRLILKGKGLPSNEKKKKKKRKRDDDDDACEVKREKVERFGEEQEDKRYKERNAEAEETCEERYPVGDEEVDEDLLLLEEEQNPNWTPAEKAFRLAQKKREKDRVNERLKLTHRQRMEKLNIHLASLSEHFDQPRVGPG
ncbi:hypothetical protein TGME49_202568 [Toxoplasma gondii ME49]|uniref:Uncharacterized protein n=1 Tax=Toxoplasma gondii (strain ATCC 50611 / Me49) TaxID=508771 RepID=S8GEE7_TOXGM|nr:hypothetical protein TGME49_202568 [Toxoplasma gondii ME49]EPT30210.1 hypothetical protein TGME49_202568 [Toxoplasma gondii ME49]|eukprot:XP_018637396.1 hypothetical protein TGME49_202568 [Toxoplasma gondii ME49]